MLQKRKDTAAKGGTGAATVTKGRTSMWSAVCKPHSPQTLFWMCLPCGCVMPWCLVCRLTNSHLQTCHVTQKTGGSHYRVVSGITARVMPPWSKQQEAVRHQSARRFYIRLAVSKPVTEQGLAQPVLCLRFMGRSVANDTGCDVSANADGTMTTTRNGCCSAASIEGILL